MGAAILRPPSEPALAAFTEAAGAGAAAGAEGAGAEGTGAEGTGAGAGADALLATAGALMAGPSSTVTS